MHAMTFIHYAEVTCSVPYRFAKSFTGTYVDESGTGEQRTYDYAARKLENIPQRAGRSLGFFNVIIFFITELKRKRRK